MQYKFVYITYYKYIIIIIGNTFNTVVERAQQEWFHQYARTVITLERSFKKHVLLSFQKKYTTDLQKSTFDCRYKQGNIYYELAGYTKISIVDNKNHWC